MSERPESVAARFRKLPLRVDDATIRIAEEETSRVSVRDGVAEPSRVRLDRGAMIYVQIEGGIGYAATSDFSDEGLRAAADAASEWAKLSRGKSVFTSPPPKLPRPEGRYESKRGTTETLGRKEQVDLLLRECESAKIDSRIVERSASILSVRAEELLASHSGGEAFAEQYFLAPSLAVTAYDKGRSEGRSFGGRYGGFCQQGGFEILERAGFSGSGKQTAEEAIELLSAPNCPSGEMSLLLMPDQMMLQIHESIGHPLEIDRILGDERNYAGQSFVSLDMFGKYAYGSSLLNVTYDPTDPIEFASFAFDDEGTKAERVHLIKDGLLLRGLGGTTSASRLGDPSMAIATTRACAWNRPPIDRMSNLNVEPGTSSLEEMIASVELGVMMKTNLSWSIDDSRNKFQFGCEWGRMIRDGKLAEVVRSPNYRGISATFWRSLAMVGSPSTREVLGVPHCGKGEPNQVLRVGHASPACLFDKVVVFGGEA